MKTKPTYFLLLLFATTAAVPSLWAQGRFERHQGPGRHMGMGMPMGPGIGIERFSDELNLTSDQLTKIKSIRIDLRKKAIEVRAKIQLAELELRELMQADTPNESQIKSKVEAVGKLRTDLRLARVEGMLSIHQVLSAEQKAKLKELRQQHRKDRGERGPQMRQRRQGFRRFNNDYEFRDMDLVPETPNESEGI